MSHEEEADRGLQLFKSPLIHSTSVSASSPGPPPEHHTHHANPDHGRPEVRRLDTHLASSDDHTLHERPEFRRLDTHLALPDDHTLHERPEFRRHTEATNSELFYDLFFVANLTVFTTVHEVNSAQTLEQYVGFFCILWLTWYQVGLYDVRFSMDSVFERAAKACHFGVMLGFAITGPKFDVGQVSSEQEGEGPSYRSFQYFSLILMASRLILVCQYIQSLFFMRHFKRTRLPMVLIASTYSIAAVVYLGLFWSFHPSADGSQNNSFIAWYVVAIMETALVTTISCIWRHISFKGTHLVQRMSLLTLIILGEGVIGLAERCSAIVEATVFDISAASTLGNVCCGIFILYFLYMLYFDRIQEKHFGTIRQQIWAFLHFPLHVFLVLAVEGVGQCLIWNAATVADNNLTNDLTHALEQLVNANYTFTTDPSVWRTAASSLNDTATIILQAGVQGSKNFRQTTYILDTVTSNVNAALRTVASGTTVSSENFSDQIQSALILYFGSLSTVLYDIAGFSPPSSTYDDGSSRPASGVNELENSALEEFNRISNVFELTFIYFFVSVGLVIIFNSCIAAISERSKSKLHWVRSASSCFLGVSLCLIALIALSNSPSSPSYAFTNYASSPYILPTVALTLFVAVLIHTIKPPPWMFARLRRPDLEDHAEATHHDRQGKQETADKSDS
ncbi:bacterial low temperature requirement A protein-domain-containing protein [Neohortaea acidophila]|uniref:Bacterial low temperature requirement A protein-domain-containing protein n=1 Tax=Neohortaea acidophila TaxID=245834 RepID=A0A6A6Q275_9PEZI|nr:bacterial low temperature requirement A protein-domain-containing protein [Neohortaea acidophila]KAF2486405.1 bacterial low temperature requirement A protein-domain-containing protein [Neohortaea acidophila]